MAKKRNTKRNRVAKKSLKQKFEEHPITVIATAIVCFLGVPAAIIGLFMQIRECAVEFSPPEPSIEINELDPLSAQNVNTDQPILVKQNDTIIPVADKEYVIDRFSSNDCKYNIQYILVTNLNKSNDITLTNFRFNAENIEVDFTPVISTEYSYNNINNSFLIQICNKGWSDISNIKIKMMDKDNKLDFSKYSTSIDTIRYGTTHEQNIYINLSDFDFLKNQENCHYPLCFEISYNEAQESSIIETNYSIHVENSKVSIHSGGAILPHTGGLLAYGICIDTAKSDYTLSQPIQEIINSGQVLEVPFFFFPNRSCEFDYYIEFDVLNGDKKQTVRTDLKHVKYRVSSTVNLNQYDASHYDASQSELLKKYNGILSYPYTFE